MKRLARGQHAITQPVAPVSLLSPPTPGSQAEVTLQALSS